MQAVIICAGKSTRTYPLTLTRPKPLLKAAGKTLIEHNLEQLEGIFSEAILVIGYRAEMIREHLGESFGRMKLRYAEQKEQLGSGHALMAAKESLKGSFLVMNGDDLFSRKDIELCLEHKYCVLAKEVEDLNRFGEVVIENNLVKKIDEKPKKNIGLANTGLYVLGEDVFKIELKKSKRGEFEIVDYISRLAEKGEEVHCNIVKDYWLPVTYPWNLLDANEFLMKKIKKKIKGDIEKGATLKGEIVVGENTVIKAGAYIEGPVIIGRDCIIGPNCYIRANSAIGDVCKIGNAVEIKNSIIGDNTNVGHLSYIGDSVIGEDVNIAAGNITANLRHDKGKVKSLVNDALIDSGRKKLGVIIGDEVKTGINTSFYPGRKIWPMKTTLPGEVVKKDIQ